ncbi:PotD/PotF family extracellular solute-binding protein [Bradyrhizobium neotropicale]|uniref:ABC transporter substrate-binding protein n=1 Tax=Bradyrhizobium neotropicale TaxID=1497615 RepID=UPI001AD743FC|nr:extracellular solute-binding protein [Bradyrhizobium neotropicale]MBO4220976.1 extracellular solute-binding protein [Bradyrhizobium neotropicale]
MSYLMNRRGFLAGATSAMALMSSAGGVRAEGGQIIVANWGGDWNDRTVQFFEAPIVEKAGYTVVRDLDGFDQRRTKIIASRRLPRAPMDVAHMDDATAFELASLEALDAIDEQAVPRLKDTLSILRTPTFVPWQYSAWIIGYNPKKLKEAPKSFADLWDPKYKGIVGLSDAHWFHHIESTALKLGKSLDNINIEAVKASMMEWKKAASPRIYPNHLQIEQALKNEEILVAPEYKARILQFASEGVDVVSAYPAEGGIGIIFGLVMPKKGPNPQAAKFYCNALLDPDGLTALVQKSFYSPSNTKSVLPEAAAKQIEFTEQEKKAIHSRPHAFWLKNRNDLLDWWNKEFKS